MYQTVKRQICPPIGWPFSVGLSKLQGGWSMSLAGTEAPMNTYLCQIDLKQEAKALIFAKAVEDWMGLLKSGGVVSNWRLSRRKMNLASAGMRDFILEIEFENLAQMDEAFRFSASSDEETRARHRAVHDLIGAVDYSLYRPFPDPQRSERMGLL